MADLDVNFSDRKSVSVHVFVGLHITAKQRLSLIFEGVWHPYECTPPALLVFAMSKFESHRSPTLAHSMRFHRRRHPSMMIHDNIYDALLSVQL